MERNKIKLINMKEKTPMAMEDEEKSLYLTMIQKLSQRLKSFQLLCDKLKQQNKDLVSELEYMNGTVEYLQYSLADLELDEQRLRERLEKQAEKNKAEEKAVKLQERDDTFSSQALETDKLEDAEKQLEVLKRPEMTPEANEEPEEEVDEGANQEPEEEAVSQTFFHLKQLVEEILQIKSDITSEEKSIYLIRHKIEDQTSAQKTILKRFSKKLQDLQKREKTHKLWSGEVRRLEKSYKKMVDQNETNRQRLAPLLVDCHQEESLIAQLGAQLQRERSRRVKVEQNIKLSVSVLRAVMKDAEIGPKAEQKMQKILGVLEESEPQESGTTRQESSEQISGGANPQTSSSEMMDSDPLFLLAKERPCDPSSSPPLRGKHQAAPPVSSQPPPGREKPPPMRLNRWQTAFNKLTQRQNFV